MSEFREHATHQLSGGQKQRVAIAGVLAMRPKCIVLDEATAMLDPRGRGEVLEAVHRLNRELGITVLLITHHMREAIDADRVVVFSDGFLLADGTPQTVFSATDILDSAGLGVPDTVSLSEALGLPLTELTVEQCAQSIFTKLNVSADRLISIPPTTATASAPYAAKDALLVTEQLRHLYSADTPFATEALKSIDFSLERGMFAGLIGHTGSGKSTFIQHLNGLLKPTGGRVLLNGADIWGNGKVPASVRAKVGLVFQYPEYQLFEETVYKDIAFGPRNMKLPEREIDERVKEAAAFVGLTPGLLEKSPFALSGGEKRRAAIAGVLAMRPDALILDEPTAGLDPAGSEMILLNLRAYREATGCTLLLVTHSMEEIAEFAGRIFVFNDGGIEASGNAEEIFAGAARLREIGLDVPEVTQVVIRLRELGVDIPPSAHTVQAVADAVNLIMNA
jgi:energy-coupling factor transport system ATP-binding protein